jgi:GAF domain-containing protein
MEMAQLPFVFAMSQREAVKAQSNESVDLRDVLRDVVALAGPPAVWVGRAPQAIADSLADALMQMLRLDLVLVQFTPTADSQTHEVVCASRERPGAKGRSICESVTAGLNTGRDVPTSLPHPLGNGTLGIVTTPIGLAGDLGTVVAGSTRRGFPSDSDDLLLRVVANQAAVVLQRAQVQAEHDQAEKQHARLLLSEQAARFALLAEMSRSWASALDPDEILRSLARAAVPALADWCVVDILEEDGRSLRQVAAEHVDTRKAKLAGELRRRYGADSDDVIKRVLPARRPELITEITDVELAAGVHDSTYLELLRELGMISYMIVPLLVRGQALGVISLINGVSGRHYRPEDLALAKDLASRAALAIDNARLYQQTREEVRKRDECLAAVAHELKTPLASIKGTSQLLKRNAAWTHGVNPGRLINGLATIDAIATRMAQQIDELLDLSRLEMGQSLTLRLAPTDLVDLLRRAVAEQQQTTQRHDLRVETGEATLVGTV